MEESIYDRMLIDEDDSLTSDSLVKDEEQEDSEEYNDEDDMYIDSNTHHHRHYHYNTTNNQEEEEDNDDDDYIDVYSNKKTSVDIQSSSLQSRRSRSDSLDSFPSFSSTVAGPFSFNTSRTVLLDSTTSLSRIESSSKYPYIMIIWDCSKKGT